MILPAFSEVLKEQYAGPGSAEGILHDWLSEVLSQPPCAGDHVASIIHEEIELVIMGDERWVCGKSPSGVRLVNALEGYCTSYENFHFSRWLHHLRASDFPMV